MSQPTFFISSTIYDFRDLRSALKYCLEEYGATVYASEFNDFPKPLDTHSYDACLTSLNKADYFILLIGTRVGGWFSAIDRISITQQEYREAYKLHKQGKLKILSFVRSEVWQFKEQRNELKRVISEQEVASEVASSLLDYPSKFSSDAEFLSSFITEIGKNVETKQALKYGTPLPTNNWIHTFSNFRDIWDVIRTQVFSGIPIEELVVRKLLSRELTEILKTSLIKGKGSGAVTPLYAIVEFHKNTRIIIDGVNGKNTRLSDELFNRFFLFGVHLLPVYFQTQVIERALESRYFLDFDPAIDSYTETSVYEALYLLREEIRRFSKVNKSDVVSVIINESAARRTSRGGTVDINTMALVPFLSLVDRWVNVIQLASAILRYLYGAEFKKPYLRPCTPIAGMDEEFAEESLDEEEVIKFLGL